MATRPPSDRVLFGIVALLFAGSATVTAAWCASMAEMPGMEMPGGWTMSMTWMRMPGQTWIDGAAMFLGMWALMMLAMMLPAITPTLRDYRRAVWGPRVHSLTARVAVAYFGVWLAAGLAIYLSGAWLAELAMQMATLSRVVPVLAAAALVVAGTLQLGAWKQRQLACCRALGGRAHANDTATAWRHGLRLGFHCFTCCVPLTLALLVAGVMNPVAMSAATVAITLERLTPRGMRIARLSGLLLIGAAPAVLMRALA